MASPIAVTAPAAPVGGGSLKRSLGLWAIVGLGLGYMTPTVVFDTFGIVSGQTDGAVPSAYLIALVIMALTAISYGKMVRVYPAAGSAYTYVRESMHPNLGFMVGWASLLDYLLLPMVNALIIRLYLEQVFPGLPPWVTVVVYTVFVTTVICLSMRGTSNLNMVLLIGAVLAMIAFVVFTVIELTHGAGAGTIVSAEPFVHDGVTMSALLTGATVVCFSFIGFDAVTMYTEEAKSIRIMPKAIMLTVLLGGAIFLVSAYFAQLRFPTNAPFGEFTDDPLPQIGLLVGGPVFQAVLVSAGFVAALASGLASHASVARMLMVMGRNNVLPKRVFGYVHPRTHTPVFNVVCVGAVTLLAMSFSLDTIAAYINFGALIAFTFVNATVIVHFAIRNGRRHTAGDRWRYIVLPGVAMLLTGVLWSQLHADALIAGGVWAAIGFVYLLVITKGFRVAPKGFDENQPVTGVNKQLTDQA
ncbi:APC family permease [Curtobacterium flaccumfaciens pv. flaccumfaciens]|uniref:APC family permease n=1 Tax=Curtobacterium flaccumfaciens TaxID=2035 RepID=UPI001BDEE702|nr:APC family permease [Curtobacterium flaccumfaciens]MBT1670259.1 APC family permease [Curtobacterium flaccumfaciens pv. flaccumfaciens]